MTDRRPARTVGVLAAAAAACAVATVLWRPGLGLDAPTELPAARPPDPAWVKHERAARAVVDAVRAAPPAPDPACPHPLDPVPAHPTPDLSAFRIVQDHRVYDLRGWRPVGPGDGPHAAAVVMDRKLKMVKLAAAGRAEFLARTSGAGLVVRALAPAPAAARVTASAARPVVEGRAMTEHRLAADVSAVPVGAEFELAYRVTYWNSLQTPDEQWFGTVGFDGSNVLSLLVLFPAGRPFRGGGLRAGPADGPLAPYDGTQVVFREADGSWVYWEVPGPRTGHVYRLDWKW